jgi:TPR repeat protein
MLPMIVNGSLFSDKCSDVLIPVNLSESHKERVISLITKANRLYHQFKYEQAFKLYDEVELISSEIGHVNYRLGVMYHDGHYVQQDIKKAETYFSKALVLLKQAATNGEAESQCDLGYMYYCGRGTKVDYNSALNFYKEASDQGHCRAINNLGHMYRDGHGTKTDLKKACELYQRAGEKGYDRAQSSLAFMYLKGYGVPIDKKQAIFWYQLADMQKYDRATQSLANIFESLSPNLKQEYALIGPKYLAEKWPNDNIHSNLCLECQSAICELFLVFRNIAEFPIELVYLLAKFVIIHWPYNFSHF